MRQMYLITGLISLVMVSLRQNQYITLLMKKTSNPQQ